jgi:hypothetical protein
MNPLNLSKTNTTKFIMAMLFNDTVKYNDILENHFIDSYTYDFYEPENDNNIIIVKNDDEPPIKTITPPIKQYNRGKNFIFVYEIPKQYQNEHNLILKGDYTNLSPDYKLKLINFWDEDWNDRSEYTKLLIATHKIHSNIFRFNPFEEIYKKAKVIYD